MPKGIYNKEFHHNNINALLEWVKVNGAWNKGVKVSEAERLRLIQMGEAGRKAKALKPRKTKKNLKCIVCNNSFEKYLCHIKADPSCGKFCSKKCHGIYIKENQKFSKENNPKWKGGISDEDYIERRRFRMTMQKIVFKRDDYKCVLCREKGELHVDHIKRWSKFPELRFDINNCRTLCTGCHYKITFGKPMPSTTKKFGHNFSKKITLNV